MKRTQLSELELWLTNYALHKGIHVKYIDRKSGVPMEYKDILRDVEIYAINLAKDDWDALLRFEFTQVVHLKDITEIQVRLPSGQYETLTRTEPTSRSQQLDALRYQYVVDEYKFGGSPTRFFNAGLDLSETSTPGEDDECPIL